MNSFYPESRFGNFTDIDGTIIFYTRVNELLKKNFTVLDTGCGRGAYGDDDVSVRKNIRIVKEKVNKVIGIDVDEKGNDNPYIDEFRLLKTDIWPVDTDSVDLIICDSVLEHIKTPEMFFSEANRALKKDGYLCIRTPNKWNYISVISEIIPDRLHSKYVEKAQNNNRTAEDVFPVFYKCNSITKIKKMLKNHNFDSVVYGYEAEPSYLSFSRIAYFFGVLHQKLAPSIFRPAIFAFGKKISE